MRHTALTLVFLALLATAQAGHASESFSRSEASSYDSSSAVSSYESRSNSEEDLDYVPRLGTTASAAFACEEYDGEEESIEDAPSDPLFDALLTAVFSGDTEKIREMVSAHLIDLRDLPFALETCCTCGFLGPLAAILGQLPPDYKASSKDIPALAELKHFAKRKQNGTFEILRPFFREGKATALQGSTDLARRLVDLEQASVLVEEAAALGNTAGLETILTLKPALAQKAFFKTAIRNSLLLGKRGPVMLVFDRMPWDLTALNEMLLCARIGGVIDAEMGSLAWGRFLKTNPDAKRLAEGMSRLHDKRSGASSGLSYWADAVARFWAGQDDVHRGSALYRVMLVHLLVFGARHACGLVICEEIVRVIFSYCW